MKLRLKYEIDQPEAGVIAYREGSKEYQFPVFEQEGEIILVAWPTRQRIFLFFSVGGWTVIPKTFSEADRQRITPRLVQHLRESGKPVQIMIPTNAREHGFEFHPELFECRNRASDVLAEAGLVWLSDYGSIDIVHEEYGLEVSGIRQESSINRIAQALQAGFPHWHYFDLCHYEGGREPGWTFTIHMFPQGCGGARCVDAD